MWYTNKNCVFSWPKMILEKLFHVLNIRSSDQMLNVLTEWKVH